MQVVYIKTAFKIAAGLTIGLAATVLGFGQTGPELKVGDPAPPFSLVGSDGKTHRLADHKGTAVVLAWFPKAFTGG
jgi:hypothetical protein